MNVLLPLLASLSCAQPECAQPAFDQPECRVIVENQLARLITSDGVELRFEDPSGDADAPWSARGLLHVLDDGRVQARVSTLGDFALSVQVDGPAELTLELDNVHPLQRLSFVPPDEGFAELTQVTANGLSRRIQLSFGDGEKQVARITGRFPPDTCGQGFRLAALADVQTNPYQLREIVQSLHDEANDGGPPLLGVLIMGDVAEHAIEEEMHQVRDLLANAPVPAAVVPGNHDVFNAQDAVFTRTFGPGNMAFDVCSMHVVMLDTGNGGLADSVVGRLPDLLRRDSERQPLLVAGMHHPPFPGLTSGGWTQEDQAQLLLAELASRDAELVLAGHLHRRKEHGTSELPVREIIVGTAGAYQGLANPDYGYLRMTAVGGQLDTCFVPVLPPGGSGLEDADWVQPGDCSREPCNCD